LWTIYAIVILLFVALLIIIIISVWIHWQIQKINKSI